MFDKQASLLLMIFVFGTTSAVKRSCRTHPCLFYDPQDVSRLRLQAKTTHREIAAEIIAAVKYDGKLHLPPVTNAEYAASWPEVWGNNLPPLALYVVLYPEDVIATRFLIRYMDRMAGYDSWRVTAAPHDDVAVSHSLVGFATALDMMYGLLDGARRQRYVSKVAVMAEQLYKMSFTKWWGEALLQNHVATNVVAILIGSLVVEQHVVRARRWLARAVEVYGRTMRFLTLVDDGSLTEGVGYGGYTVRSLSQYVFLLRRHLDIDYTRHSWLRRHFDFYYYTTLPGLQFSVGLADCPPTWFYGPESQLIFLDTFVLREGHANWLAEQIRRRRGRPDPRSGAHRYTTLHTEFLWYDPSLPSRPPPQYREAELYYFSDWGVVTYRSGDMTTSTTTYLTLKSGKLHGRAVFDSVHAAGGPDDVRMAWKHFNAGHEHPDQNSFTFSPGGRRLITDGLYGPKLSYLNNVLLLAPGDASACTRPWTGQLGDCDRWLRWLGPEDGRSHGEVLTTQLLRGVVLMAGDAAGAYHPSLRLRSVRRTLLLLTPDLLLVVDDIRILADSHVTHVSTFFNNHEHQFKRASHFACEPAVSGVEMQFDDGVYGVAWTSAGGQSPVADVKLRNYSSSRGMLNTSNVNVTYVLEGRHTRLVHVMFGAQATPTSLRVVGDIVTVTTAWDSYNVTVRADVTDVPLPLCKVTSRRNNVTFYPAKPRRGSTTYSRPTRGNSDMTQHLADKVHVGQAGVSQRPLQHPLDEPKPEQQRSLHEPQRSLHEPQRSQSEQQRSSRERWRPLVRPPNERQHPPDDPSVPPGDMSVAWWYLCGTVLVFVYCRCGSFNRYKMFSVSLVLLSLFSLLLYVY